MRPLCTTCMRRSSGKLRPGRKLPADEAKTSGPFGVGPALLGGVADFGLELDFDPYGRRDMATLVPKELPSPDRARKVVSPLLWAGFHVRTPRPPRQGRWQGGPGAATLPRAPGPDGPKEHGDGPSP